MLEDDERWEPPAPRSASRGAAGQRERRPRAVTAAIGPSIHRLLIAAVLGVALIVPSPETWLSAAGPLVVLALAVVPRIAHRVPPGLRVFWRVDGVAFGVLLPLLILNAFAGARDGTLLVEERVAYVETMVIVLIVAGLMLAWVVAARPRPADDRSILLLPAALQFLAVAAVATDLQPASLSRSLGVTWLVAAVVTLLAAGAAGAARRIIPIVGYGVALVGYLIASPRLVTLGGQESPIAVVHPLILVAVTGALLWSALAGTARGGSRGGRRRARGARRDERRTAVRLSPPDDEGDR